MSNEELVAEIQAGNTDRMGELWEQIDGLVKQQAKRIISALELRGNPCGIEFEDLYQTGYIALADAVNTYKPEGMSFSSWLVYYLKSAFAAATGYRTTSGQNEPLNNSLSLDVPISSETDEITLGDCIEDPRAADELEQTAEEVWGEQLLEELAHALDNIPKQRADILRLRYFGKLTLQETSRKIGVSRSRVARRSEEVFGI